MKLKHVLVIFCLLSTTIYASDIEVQKASDRLCQQNEACKDIVDMNLKGAYYEGLNEKQNVTIGTLINRKSKSLLPLCDGFDSSLCKEYKDQIMLRYINGLLSR